MEFMWFPAFWPTKELREKRVAWQLHYMAKGCSREKAFRLAMKKWASSPMPPQPDRVDHLADVIASCRG